MFQNLQLEAIHLDCWGLLEQAVTDRDCGWRLPTLATLAPAGVRQRTVVLRAVDSVRRQVFLHTDVRSAKIGQIRENPQVSLLFYDHTRSVQLMLQGKASIHTNDETADILWQHSPPEALRGYLGPLPPGMPVDEFCVNLPPFVQGRIPERAEVESGRPHFAVVSVTVEQSEWLRVSRSGNCRAVFRYFRESGEVRFTAEWLVP